MATAADKRMRIEIERQAAAALSEIYPRVLAPSEREALDRWLATFGTACGAGLSAAERPLQAWAKRLGIAGDTQPAAFLYAAHRWFAALVEAVVARRLADDRLPLASILGTDYFPPLDDAFPALHTAIDRSAIAAHDVAGTGGDAFKSLYQTIFPAAVRRQLGEFYTPDWLAELVLDEADFTGRPQRLVDPTCGSGTFLVHALQRLRKAGCHELPTLLNSVAGIDLNPLAAVMARANYLLTIADRVTDWHALRLPVQLADAVLGPAPPAAFDCVVGNPPWTTWDRLPADYRSATRELWQRYGLFSLNGGEARLGGGKKDLAMLVVYASADRFLRPGGRLAMVVTQTLWQTRGAGDGFRRFQLGGDGPPLAVRRVNDLAALRPFDDAANWTSTLLLEKGAPTRYPVPYIRWRSAAERSAAPRREPCTARPIDPARASSPWLVLPEGCSSDIAGLCRPADYRAYLGANSGGANGVYWLEKLGEERGLVRVRNLAERGKQQVVQGEYLIEPELLYPLARWGDVGRWRTEPSAWLLLAQDPQTRMGIGEDTLRTRWPRTFAYLGEFRKLLLARAAYRRYQEAGPFWSMYNVGPYTLAEHKVVWRRMTRRIEAAVAGARQGRCVVPQETCVFIPAGSADEAHYLAAVLNAAPADFLARAHSVSGGKGFGSPGMLEYLPVGRFVPGDPLHQSLAEASRAAHARAGEVSPGLEEEIDHLAGRLWGLTRAEIELLRRELRNGSIRG